MFDNKSHISDEDMHLYRLARYQRIVKGLSYSELIHEDPFWVEWALTCWAFDKERYGKEREKAYKSSKRNK